jgi:hypothetical protein
MAVNGQNRIVGVIGRKGSGKSTTSRELISCRDRVVIFDLLCEYASPNVFTDYDEFLGYLDRHPRSRMHCAYRPIDERPEDVFEDVCNAVYDAGALCFVVEEAARFCGPGHLPSGFDRVIRLGRHRAIDTVWITQRASEVSRTLTAMTDVFLFIGASTEPRDLNAIAERCGQDVALKVQGLGLHGRLIYDVLKGKMAATASRV